PRTKCGLIFSECSFDRVGTHRGFPLNWSRQILICLEMPAWRRPALGLALPRGTCLPQLPVVIGRNDLIVIVEMKVLVFLVPMWPGMGDILGIVHALTHALGSAKQPRP